MAGIDMMSSTF